MMIILLVIQTIEYV